MKVLWAPWRMSYVERPAPDEGCIFCTKADLQTREQRRVALLLYTTEQVSVLMNRFPYGHAHLMVAPRSHVPDLKTLPRRDAHALSDALQLCLEVLTRAYDPRGFNVGINLGCAAGAGIADHLHWHVVPRWEGDTNFMPILSDVRVMPQHLMEAYDKLHPLFVREQT